jgi:3-hydroxymyristoyl/3-hydroxydecanoyl-(acyl carrier protein) dehydratase
MNATVHIAVADPHPACEGHFPGAPLLPAVALLDEVLHALEPAAGGRLTVAAAKFLAAVRPGDLLALGHERSPDGSWRFTLSRGGQTVASGLLRQA